MNKIWWSANTCYLSLQYYVWIILTLVARSVFFHLTEILLVQLIWNTFEKNGFSFETGHLFCKVRTCTQNESKVYRFGRYTDLPKDKQSPAVFLSLPPNIWACIQHLAITDISRGDGLKMITDKLDKICLCNMNMLAYMACKDFYSHRRMTRTNINNFWYVTSFCIRNYKNLESTCQKEFRPFLD